MILGVFKKRAAGIRERQAWININPGETYFENSSKYYLKSSLNKLRIALHSILRKDFIVYFFSSDPEGEWKNSQRVLKFLPLIFGSETSKQVKWVRNVRVDYSIFKITKSLG
jgi:hypothetical protein